MISVAFVDDEPNILDALRRTLYKQRNVWHMEFFNGGAEAIARFSERRFDVVVTDMRMPGVDGFAVLSWLLANQPQTMRIVLSGQTDLEVAMRIVPMAHQFLAKPAEPIDLRAAISRAENLSNLFSSPDLRAVVARFGCLPALPQAYAELSAILRDGNAGIKQITDTIGRDVGLSATVLHLASSAFFSLTRPPKNISHAISLLGINTIRALILADGIYSPYRGSAIDPAWLQLRQQRSLQIASAARSIAQGGAAADQAFLAGLICDMGELLLALEYPRVLAQVAEQKLSGEQQVVYERAEIGADHAVIGGFLAEVWGLPHPIVEAIICHQHIERLVPARTSAAFAVHVAAAVVETPPDQPLLLHEGILAHVVAGELEEWRALFGSDACRAAS